MNSETVKTGEFILFFLSEIHTKKRMTINDKKEGINAAIDLMISEYSDLSFDICEVWDDDVGEYEHNGVKVLHDGEIPEFHILLRISEKTK